MSYKNDSYLVIANKFGGASSKAKAQLFETYDQLRDLTVSGQSTDGAGFGSAGSFLWQIARLIAPSSFMSVMGGGTSMNVPGTSYWSGGSMKGGTSAVDGGYSSFGIGNLGDFSGFAAPLMTGYGTDGVMTGAASALTAAGDVAGITGLNAASYAAGIASGFGAGNNWVLPAAGVVSGWGGILQAMSPYLGSFGLGSTVVGNLLQGTSSAALAAYQNVTGSIQSNADVILTNKVKNIETVCKMLDTQSDIVKKMLKDSIEGNKKSAEQITQ